jgi:hypothetical protein
MPHKLLASQPWHHSCKMHSAASRCNWQGCGLCVQTCACLPAQSRELHDASD